MRGAFKKKKAKVSNVNLTKTRVSLENIQRTKKDGTKITVHFHPSVLQIQTIGSDDRYRIAGKAAQNAETSIEKKETKLDKKSEKKTEEKKEVKSKQK